MIATDSRQSTFECVNDIVVQRGFATGTVASAGPVSAEWSAWRREGAFGLAPARLWVAVGL